MKSSLRAYVRLELLRTVRDPLYTFLAVVAPIGFYLLFSGLFGGAPAPRGELPADLEIMVATATYGGVWACLVATGPRLATERGNGWLRNLQLLPITLRAALLGRVIAAIIFALPAICLVCLTAVIDHGVKLSAIQWVVVIGSMWIGVWPFAILGIVIGTTTTVESAFGITFGLYQALSALGGLWVPPAILPATMLAIGEKLPTYQAAAMGWRLANGQSITWASILGLLVWTVIFTSLATIFARRALRTR